MHALLDGLTHMILELSYLYYALGATAAKSTGPFAAIWRQYGLADARWAVRDANVISLEILTVFAVGPLCFYLVYAILTRSAWRHVVQVIVCTCELYGGAMTFMPEWLSGSPNLVRCVHVFICAKSPRALITRNLTCASPEHERSRFAVCLSSFQYVYRSTESPLETCDDPLTKLCAGLSSAAAAAGALWMRAVNGVWIVIPLLLLVESMLKLRAACDTAKTESQPPALAASWFSFLAGVVVTYCVAVPTVLATMSPTAPSPSVDL